MDRSAVIRHHPTGHGNEGQKLWKRNSAGSVIRWWQSSLGCDCTAQLTLVYTSNQNRSPSQSNRLASNLRESALSPSFRSPDRSGRKDQDRAFPTKSVTHLPHCLYVRNQPGSRISLLESGSLNQTRIPGHFVLAYGVSYAISHQPRRVGYSEPNATRYARSVGYPSRAKRSVGHDRCVIANRAYRCDN